MNQLVKSRLEEIQTLSAWSKGVKEYALELIDGAEVELTSENVLKELLNGADSWYDYSWGGCALIYDGDIVERLSPPSTIKRFKKGWLNKPNSREDWLDVQTRALKQAYGLIERALKYK